MITEYCGTVISTTVPKRCRLPPPLAALASPWLANAWIPAGILGHHDRRRPKKIAGNMNDPCGAKCPQLPKLL